MSSYYYIKTGRLFKDKNADFTDQKNIQVARKNKVSLIGGPLLGYLRENGISLWLTI